MTDDNNQEQLIEEEDKTENHTDAPESTVVFTTPGEGGGPLWCHDCVEDVNRETIPLYEEDLDGFELVRCISCGAAIWAGDVDRPVPDRLPSIDQRADVGASTEVTIKRGTETRDQETWKLKGKGESAGEAIRELRTQLADVTGLEPEGAMADKVRGWTPEAPEEEEADDE